MQSSNRYRALWIVSLTALLATACCAQSDTTPLQDLATSLVSKIVTDPGARDLKGKVAVVTEFQDPGKTGLVSTRIFQTKLITAFVGARHFKVVERDQLDKAMRELKLDASGLVDPANQKQLGRFLSAEYMVLGEVSSETGGTSLDARLVTIETGEIVTAVSVKLTSGGVINKDLYELNSWNLNEITIRCREKNKTLAVEGAVQWLVDGQVLRQDTCDNWQPELEKNVFSHPERYIKSIDPRSDAYYIRIDMTQLFRDIVAVLFGQITPRIAVATTEQLIQQPPAPDPAVQTSISSALLKYGFQVVDSEQAQSALEREQFLQVDSGDAAALKVVATELKADIIVKGESIAEQHTNGDGFDARVEFAIAEGTTGRLLTSIADTQRNVAGGSPIIAAKTALQKAADKSTLRMVGEILNSYGQPVSRLRVWKFADFEDQSKIIHGLQKALPGAVVSPVSMDLRSSKCAVFSVSSKRSVNEIASALKNVSGVSMKVTGVECRSIVCELQ